MPELGVGDIQRRTFGDWAEALDIQLASDDHVQTLHQWFETEPGQGTPDIDDNVSGRYKGSLRLMEIIRRVESIEAEALPDGDFSPWDGAVLKQETIAEWFYQEYKPYPLAKRKERRWPGRTAGSRWS